MKKREKDMTKIESADTSQGEKILPKQLKTRLEILTDPKTKSAPNAFMNWRDDRCGCVYSDRG